jgi:hypothetical protein
LDFGLIGFIQVGLACLASLDSSAKASPGEQTLRSLGKKEPFRNLEWNYNFYKARAPQISSAQHSSDDLEI